MKQIMIRYIDNHTVFRKVDDALYRAKETGRNRIVTAQI